MSFQIRDARKEDLGQVLVLIKELADYENALEEVVLTVERLEADGFGEDPLYHLLVAESNKKVIGIALTYYRYSTWKGKTLFLEDIVVSKNERGNGVGTALFEKSIQCAKQQNCHRMSWQVLDWNEPAINFYKKYRTSFDGEWLNCDFHKQQIDEFGS